MVNLVDAIRLQLLIERLKAAEAKRLIKVIGEVENTTNELLSGIELSELTRAGLAKALTTANAKLTFIGNGIVQQYREALTEFARKQALLESKLFGNGIGITPDSAAKIIFETPLAIDPPARGMALDVYLDTWFKAVRQSVMGTITRSTFERKPNLQMRREIIGSRQAQYKDGLLDSLRRNAVTTSNTSVQHAMTSIREGLLAATGQGIVWSSMLERNTCSRCAALDGRFFPQGSGPRSPVHTGCRCIMVPGSASDSLPRESYYQWLKGQDERFIGDVLGQTRAVLFLKGGITAQEFSDLQLDRKFEPLTLSELHKIAPSIFSHAGL